MKRFISIFLLLVGAFTANAQDYDLLELLRQEQSQSFDAVKAFPEAEGFGKNATGGRGGVVLKVTNLNNDGVGSLRDALQWTFGTRTIVFEVGGTINLSGDIDIVNPNVTVAGQTAPGDGILIKGGMLTINTSNVILRYLRFRGDEVALPSKDCVAIAAFSDQVLENIIIDHCSTSWGGDENINIRSVGTGIVDRVTIQNSITSEGAYGLLQDGNVFNVTYYNNLFANNQERNIASNLPVDGTFAWEMVNNIIYGCFGATGVAFGTKFTVLNNLYKESSEQAFYSHIIDPTATGQGTPSETYAYVTGNIVPAGYDEYNIGTLGSYIEASPFATSGIIPLAASLVEASIISHVGCSYPNRDTVDTRIIQQFNDGDGTLETSGTFPTINSGTPPTDANNDGISDTWAATNMPGGATYNDTAPNGYTWLEVYLNQIDKGGIVLNTPTQNIYENKDAYCEIYLMTGQEIYTGVYNEFNKPTNVPLIVSFGDYGQKYVFKN